MNRKSHLMRRALFCAVSLLLVAGGCGGDDDGEGAGTQGARTGAQPGGTLSKSRFIAQGDRICKGFQAEMASLSPQIAAALAKADFAAASTLEEQSRAKLIAGSAGLEALPQPSGDEGELQEIEDAGDRVIDLNGELLAAYKTEDAAQVGAVNDELSVATGERDRALAAYGFEVCGAD